MSFGPEIDGFLDKLSKTERTWRLYVGNGRIRSADCRCPLEVTGGQPRGHWFSAGLIFGMDVRTMSRIARAADNEDDHDPALRAALLEACGLTEQSS